MNYLEFFSSLVDSLAWPLALFFIVLKIKEPLFSLFPRMKKISYNNFQIELNDVSQNLNNLIENPDINNKHNYSNKIQDEWIEFLKKGIHILSLKGIDLNLDEDNSPEFLFKYFLMEQQAKDVINDFYKLYKDSRHFKDELTPDSVIKFSQNMGVLKDYLSLIDIKNN